MANPSYTERSKYVFPNATDQNPQGWLSPSQVLQYLRCPSCFELDRIQHVPKPIGIALPIGGAVHQAVNHVRQAALQGAIPSDPEDVAAESFDKALTVDVETQTEIILDLGKYETIGHAKDEMVRLTRVVVPLIIQLDFERGLLAAEYDLSELPNPWPFPMKGRVDVLYGDIATGEVDSVFDLKTSSKQVAPDAHVLIQVGCYGMPFWANEQPVRLGVDVLGKKVNPDLVTYYANASGHLDDEAYGIIKAKVLDVAERIQRGDFPDHPSFYCQYEHGYGTFSVAVRGFA